MNHRRRHTGKEESFHSTNLSSSYGANVVLYTPSFNTLFEHLQYTGDTSKYEQWGVVEGGYVGKW